MFHDSNLCIYNYEISYSVMHDSHIRRIEKFSNKSEALKNIERDII